MKKFCYNACFGKEEPLAIIPLIIFYIIVAAAFLEISGWKSDAPYNSCGQNSVQLEENGQNWIWNLIHVRNDLVEVIGIAEDGSQCNGLVTTSECLLDIDSETFLREHSETFHCIYHPFDVHI